MKVFGIGLPKTGTSSLNTALADLGLRSLHNPTALRRKVYAGDFDLGDGWDALTNFGEWCFPELDRRYPGSKFILTTREKRAWIESCRRWFESPHPGAFGHLNRVAIMGCDPFREGTYSWVYDLHREAVERYFDERSADLLVLPVEAQGNWQRAKEFLGMPVDPGDDTKPWPHENAQRAKGATA